MMQWRPISVCIALAAIVGMAAWGACGLTKHIIVAIDRWGDAAPAKGHIDAVLSETGSAVAGTSTEAQAAIGKITEAASEGIGKVAAVGPVLGRAVADTAGNINRPCRNQGGPDACGTLAAASKTMTRAGDEMVTTQIEERAATPHVIAAMDAIRNAGLGLRQNSEDLNAILKDQAIQRSMNDVASMTDSWSGISGDARKVADKAAADYLKPIPWWQRPLKRAGEIVDITAAVARNIP